MGPCSPCFGTAGRALGRGEPRTVGPASLFASPDARDRPRAGSLSDADPSDSRFPSRVGGFRSDGRFGTPGRPRRVDEGVSSGGNTGKESMREWSGPSWSPAGRKGFVYLFHDPWEEFGHTKPVPSDDLLGPERCETQVNSGLRHTELALEFGPDQSDPEVRGSSLEI